MKRVVVKVGSNVISRGDDGIDITQMSLIVDQIALAYKAGYEVILVSSGSIMCGKTLVGETKEEMNSLDQRQLYSAIGQVKLIDLYYTLFKEHKMRMGQVLTTKESLNGKKEIAYQRNCMNVMLRNKVVPVINENDTISITELMFTDNDELAGLVAEMMSAEKLIILTNVDGIYTINPDGTLNTSSVVSEVHPTDDIKKFLIKKKSSFGRGGMASKSRTAIKIAADGIETYIANGRRNGIINKILDGATDVPFTHFLCK